MFTDKIRLLIAGAAAKAVHAMHPERFSRPAIAVVAAAALLVVGGTGGAIAGSMITGAQIKNNTVTSADIKDHGLKKVDLSSGTVKALRGLQGPQGPAGETGAPGETGATGSRGAAGATGATGAAGPVNTTTMALVADTSAGDVMKAITVGPFTITATCGNAPPPAGPDYQDYLNLTSYYDMSVIWPGVSPAWVNGTTVSFPAGRSTVTPAIVTRDGGLAVTITATRWRSGDECRIALTASVTG